MLPNPLHASVHGMLKPARAGWPATAAPRAQGAGGFCFVSGSGGGADGPWRHPQHRRSSHSLLLTADLAAHTRFLLEPLSLSPTPNPTAPHRVLVMERLKGVALTDLDAIRATTPAQPELVLINALNVWFGSVVGCPTFHADVHAGGSWG